MIIALCVVLYFLIGCWLVRIWPCYGLTIILWPYIVFLVIADLPIWSWVGDHLLIILTLLTIAGLVYFGFK